MQLGGGPAQGKIKLQPPAPFGRAPNVFDKTAPVDKGLGRNNLLHMRKNHPGLDAFTALAAFLLTLGASQAATKSLIDLSKLPPPANKPGLAYPADIKPILDKSCVRCHGPEKPKAGLRLDNLADALKGAGKTRVILPGNSAQSPLVHSIAHLGPEDHFMPPPGNKAGIPRLTADQVGLIRAWIDQGAK